MAKSIAELALGTRAHTDVLLHVVLSQGLWFHCHVGDPSLRCTSMLLGRLTAN